MPVQVAVLDDYQEIARDYADWDSLAPEAEVTIFHGHIAGDASLAEHLAGFEVVVAMRERTPFTAKRLAALPDLKLLVTTGMANASIDMDAAREHGITVCGTGGRPSHTAELTWGLILATTRHIVAEDNPVRAGGWQHTIGAGARRPHARAARPRAARHARRPHRPGVRDGRASPGARTSTATTRAQGVEPVARDELLERSDVVSVHLRLSSARAG